MVGLEAGDATELAHAVLFSPDLFPKVFLCLDGGSKHALRASSVAMRDQVDGCIEVVASPEEGFTGADLSRALLRWPRVRDLALLNVGKAAVDIPWTAAARGQLQPLSTASLAGLTSLTIREVGNAHACPNSRAPIPLLSHCRGQAASCHLHTS
jgi:hypothetical protein